VADCGVWLLLLVTVIAVAMWFQVRLPAFRRINGTNWECQLTSDAKFAHWGFVGEGVGFVD